MKIVPIAEEYVLKRKPYKYSIDVKDKIIENRLRKRSEITKMSKKIVRINSLTELTNEDVIFT